MPDDHALALDDPGRDLRLVLCPSAHDFIDAVKGFDDPFMNWALAIAVERVVETTSGASNDHPPSGQFDSDSEPEGRDVFAAVFQGPQLVYVPFPSILQAPDTTHTRAASP